MLSERDQQELEQQLDSASLSLLLLLFLGRRNVQTGREVEFDRRRSVFRIDGKVVSVTTIRVLLAQIEKIGGVRLRTHMDAFLRGEITLEEWAKRSASTIRVSHTLSTALAVGGIDRAQTNEEAEKRIREELTFLAGFERDIRQGKVSGPKMQSRIASYMLAVPVTYWFIDQREKEKLKELKRVKKITNGIPLTEIELRDIYKEARRYRRSSESCSGCIAYSGFWMPIDKMPPIGSLDCRSRCRCFIVYR